MANFVSPTTVQRIGALLAEGHSSRAVAKALKINRATVLKYAVKLQPEKCVCGREARRMGTVKKENTRRPANQEMIDGYLDGRDANSPEPSANRSASYHHGFVAGRSDLSKTTPYPFEEMLDRADAAMNEDDQR